MNLTALQNKIESAVKDCFLNLTSKNQQSVFNSFALYCDVDAASIAPSANTESYLRSLIDDDPDDSTYYKWSPGEWEFESEGCSFFNNISKELFSQSKLAKTEQERLRYKEQVFSCVVNALLNVKASGFFDSISHQPIIVFSVFGNEDLEKEIDWISQLNSSNETIQFKSWIRSLS